MVNAALVMFWTRLPSLNALAQIPAPRFWKQWLCEPLASADTLGRVPAGLYADQLRQSIFLVYQQLKRNKALPDHQGIGLAVLDGHESHASYRRHCAGCLQRTIHTEYGDRLQHYHRQVTLMLLPAAPAGRPALRLRLDQEPQRPGEDTPVRVIRSRETYTVRQQLDRQQELLSSEWIRWFPSTAHPDHPCRLRSALCSVPPPDLPFPSGEHQRASWLDPGPQNVLRISPAISSTPKSIRTLGHRSSQPLACGIVDRRWLRLWRSIRCGKMPPLGEPVHLGAAFSFTRRQYDREEVERFANAENRGDRRIGLALPCRRTVIPQAKTYTTAEERARPCCASRRPDIAVAKAHKPTSIAGLF